jgi:phosphatidylglycerophosphatase A
LHNWPPRLRPNLQRIISFLVTGAGAGYFPRAPGTAGTVAAIPLSLALNRIADSSLPLALLTFAAFVITAAWLCQRGEEIFRQKDSSKIVVDEIAGFLLANFAAPARLWPIIFAFLLFRFFDIIKPFPAARAEKISGGLGVIADDLIAGLYTFVILRLLLTWGIV